MAETHAERAYLNDVLPRLSDYLLGDELFWPVNAPGSPKLTLGNTLYMLALLKARDNAQAVGFATQLASVKDEWRSHWEAKAAHEYRSRLRQWTNYIEDLKKDFSAHTA